MPGRTLDLQLVRTFVCAADTGSLTRAGALVGRTQSAVSLQIDRLERALGTRLLDRTSRGARPTAEGERFLPEARRLLRMNDEVVAAMRSAAVEGTVRLGAPEDFATLHLPAVLAAFARAHPGVSLEVTCELTVPLLERTRAGGLDLALVKREPSGPDVGVRVWREPLVWVAADVDVARGAGPLPLVAAPSPCVYRGRAAAALESAGRSWRVAYASPSLAGQLAALRAGLGLGVLPREMAPRDLIRMGPEYGLPVLEDTEIALIRGAGPASAASDRLADFVLEALDRERLV